MKRHARVVSVLLLAAALAGCAPRAAWISLWSTPMPGRTPAPPLLLSPTPAASAGTPAEGDDQALFATETDNVENPRVVISKSKHTLEVYDGDTLMARMAVALGRSEGAKEKSGDNRTPEGQYYVCKATEGGKYHKSLFLSYPNADDAARGLEEGAITQEQHDSIADSIEEREQPLWDTDLGGEIAINGTGTGGEGKTGDWTAGSIAVSDADMDYLYRHIKVGADVTINP